MFNKFMFILAAKKFKAKIHSSAEKTVQGIRGFGSRSRGNWAEAFR